MNTCAGCGAEIQWKITPKGKRMPLDMEPQKEAKPGMYTVSNERCSPAQPMFDEGPYYMNHWTTCPDADSFKKEKK